VDPVSRRDFWKILYQLLREGVTIFVSTAYLDEAERCSRLALIHKGRLQAVGTPDEIKRLMRASILEVRAAAPRRAAALLRASLEAESVGLFGNRIHVVTRDPAGTTVRAQTLLVQGGLPKADIQIVAPELEDVFIAMLGDEQGD
jgi:ABC-2 type transport system ATP-binding protein